MTHCIRLVNASRQLAHELSSLIVLAASSCVTYRSVESWAPSGGLWIFPALLSKYIKKNPFITRRANHLLATGR